MRAMHLGLALLLLGLAGSSAQGNVLLIDASQGSYLNDVQQQVTLQSGRGLAVLLSALAGLVPPSQVDEEALRMTDLVVKPSPLKKPRAHMVFNVAGLSSEALADVFGQRGQTQIQLLDEEQDMEMQSLAMLASSNPDVGVTMLDFQGLQGCAGNCIEEHLSAAAGCMKAQHSDLLLTFESGDSLDLSQLSSKVFAAEAASLYSGLQAQQADDADIHMLETTLVGLQALEAEHGSDASIVASARDALKSMLRWSVDQLDTKYGGDITYQVTGLAANPARTTVADIMGWKQESRRRLAETVETVTSSDYPGDAAQQKASAQKFTAKACGYGSFILLVYFSLAAIWCMCFMPFKQDTMLFGAKKME